MAAGSEQIFHFLPQGSILARSRGSSRQRFKPRIGADWPAWMYLADMDLEVIQVGSLVTAPEEQEKGRA